MASTPPPPSPSMLRAPRAPRHGAKYDNYEPYPTRHSARIASQRTTRVSQTTPPPSHPSASTKTVTAKRTLSPSSPGTVKPSPKKAAPNHSSFSSRISSFDSDHSQPRNSALQSSRSSAERALPTPAKTPSKKKEISSRATTSRALFPPSSTSKRRRMDTPDQLEEIGHFAREPFKVHTDRASANRFGLAAAAPTPISIHTDARDRIPVNGTQEGNPFSKPGGSVAKRPATRSTTTPEDGAWFVHRGKKIFQRYDEIEDEDEDESDLGLFASRPDLLAKNPDCLKGIKPLKPMDIKPKVLFRPNAGPLNSANLSNNDEEDVTDVEDNDAVSPSPNVNAGNTHDDTDNIALASEGSAICGDTGIRCNASDASPAVSLYNGTPFTEDLRSRSQYSSTGGSLFDYWETARKTRSRQLEKPADRVKRQRETRGSPHPRTRMAKRAEASAALTPAEEASSADV